MDQQRRKIIKLMATGSAMVTLSPSLHANQLLEKKVKLPPQVGGGMCGVDLSKYYFNNNKT